MNIPDKIFIFLCLVVSQIECEYYSSIHGLVGLLEIEAQFIDNLDAFIKLEQDKLSILREDLNKLENKRRETENSIAYYENPINAFKVLKRITRDWKQLQNSIIQESNTKVFSNVIDTIKEMNIEIPNPEDVTGAAKGIARLQDTYDLETPDMAYGRLSGRNVSSEMTALDCFEMGLQLYNNEFFERASEWLLQARLKFHKKDSVLSFQKLEETHILQYLVASLTRIGNYKLAQIINNEHKEVNPSFEEIKEYEKYLETAIRDEQKKALEKDVDSRLNSSFYTDMRPKLKDLYEATCSGKLKQTPKEQKNLRCRYVDKGVPFCRLARFKMEELSLEPFIALYHETIYESEITNIISTAEADIERSKIGDAATSIVDDIRTSKNTWLYFDQHNFMKKIGQRLEDITGLTLKSSEEMQVANYGIGGHYGPHYDFFLDDNFSYNGLGNRILTALYYINDVEMGGATAFPYLKLAVPPIRRTLVVWYNMHESGALDFRTKHAGCPVLKGSKWISNEWFHFIGQERHRPCGLEPDDYKSIEYEHFAIE